MQITIVLDDKSKQVIRTPDNFREKKSPDEMTKIANTIAHDISRNNYKSVNLRD